MANGLAKGWARGVPGRLILALAAVLAVAIVGAGATARAGDNSPDVSWSAVGFESGDFAGLSRADAQSGTVRVTDTRRYGGDYAALATYLGADLFGYARTMLDVRVDASKDVWYGAAFYLPPGFETSQGGDVEIMRWDNVPTYGAHADFGGIVLSAYDHKARLFKRQGVDGPRETVMGPFDVPEGRWVFIEVRQRLSEVVPLNEVYVDGRRIGRSATQNSFGRPADTLRYGLVQISQLAPTRLWFDRVVARLSTPGASCDWGVTTGPAYVDSYLPFAKFERRWPVGCWRPYSDASPFNEWIPANARVDANSATMVKRMTDAGDPGDRRAGIADTSSDFYKPTFWASDDDPLVTLRATGSSPINGERIHVPAGARPAAGSDHHMTVIQPDGWEYDLWDAAPISNGVLVYSAGRKISVSESDGIDSAATSARFGSLAGLIRAQEMTEGRIDHALFMTGNSIAWNAVYPAAKSDGGKDPALGYPPMGTRFQLSISDAELASFPPWKRTILRAFRDYGGYLGDSSSGSAWTVGAFESGTSYTSLGFEDQMVTFARNAYAQGQSDISYGNGVYYFDLASGIDWSSRLRVIAPCATEHTC
jgi:hypothetical protein